MIEKLRTAFADIKYNDSQHRYFTSKDIELQSVTKFLSTLRPKFNSDFWSVIKAYQFSGYNTKFLWNNFQFFRILNEDGSEEFVNILDDYTHLEVSPEDVIKQWKLDSLIGTTRGSFIHDYLENLENRILDVPQLILPDGISTAEAVNYVNSIKVGKELALDFVHYANENLVLIVAEFIIGDPELKLAGRFDRLYWNKSTEQYEVWDFKTDKQIRYKSNFGKLEIFDLPDCEFEKYSLQTSLYKKIIQDNTGINLGESRVVWFNLKENKYEIITCKDYCDLLTEKLTKEKSYDFTIN
jgi:hypothetical protein